MKILFTVFYDPKDLGIRYLTAFLRQAGHDVRIVALKSLGDPDPAPLVPTPEQVDNCGKVRSGWLGVYKRAPITDQELALLTEEVRAYAPDIVGFGTRSFNFQHLPRIIPALREGAPSAFFVCGGAGPTLEPDVPLKLGMDAVIRGEGEYALTELITALEEKKDWHQIRNVAYLDKNEDVIRNPVRPLQRNLDTFPFPLINMEQDIFIDNNQRSSLFVPDDYDTMSFGSNFRYFILGSRGCPAACSYCGGRYLRDEYAKDGILVPRIRQRSLDNVLEELVQARERTPFRMVQFWDEFFIWPIAKLIRFFRLYKEKIDVPFWAYLSADQLAQSDELLEVACEAGLATFVVGLQTGDEEFCRRVYNRINHNKNILYVADKMYSRGIPVQFLMILGNPLQNQESLHKNFDFLSSLPKFDPSFVRRVYLDCMKLYRPAYDSQLYIKYPELNEKSVASRLFYYDAMLCNLRLVNDDGAFEDILNNNVYKEQPWLLGKLYHDTLEQKHLAYLQSEIKRLQGQEVYYWGCGAAYQARKKLFDAVHPLCILNDFTWKKHERMDNLEVLNPNTQVLDTGKPLVIFARHEYVHSIFTKARKQYGFKDIVVAAFIE